jgi:hypothetical protein
MPPRLARILAVLVAAGLVAGAFVVRGVLADDEGQDVMAGSDRPTVDGETYRIACDRDLGEEACAAVADLRGVDEVVMATWAEVRDMAEGGDLDVDAWLTLDPMPGVLDQIVAEVVGETVPVASSPLALLTRDETVDCAEWACILDGRIGVPARDTSAGVVIAGGAYVGLAGPDQVEDGGIRAYQDDVEVRDGLRGLDAELDLGRQETRFLTQVGSYRGIVTTGGLADLRVESRPAEKLEKVDLQPEVVVGVVLAGIGGDGDPAVDALADALKGKTVADALGVGGWSGTPAASTGLPDADVIYRLQEELGS